MSISKRSQCEARWRAIIRRQRSGRLGVAGFCRQEGLALSTFHWWRRRLESPVRDEVQWIEAEAPALQPLVPGVTSGAVMAGPVPALRAGTAGGLWIEFATPPGIERLSAALRALRAAEGGVSC
jgi:hypothetical protein